MNKGYSIIKNMSWKFAERIAAQLVTLIVSIILARLLNPSDYGIISLVMVFITIANVFVTDGLGSALIQKKNADALDFSSALYFNIGFSVIIYGILFFFAPIVSNFFGKQYEILTPILRVLSLRIIVAAINSVQYAYVAKNMAFRMFFFATLLGTVVSAVVGIWMAYYGYGAWALVGQYLTNTTVGTVVLAVIIKRRPILSFSFDRVKRLFNFGIKILGSGLLIAAYTEIRSFVIGKLYSASDLAFYDRARQFPSLFVNNIVTTISSVLFPVMADEQDNIVLVKATMKRSIRFTSYLMFPLMFGLAAVAESLVRVLLTDKWLPCVPFLQVLCIAYLWQPIHSANIQAIKAIGRSDIILKLEIIKKSIEIVVLFAVMYISVYAIVISMAMNATFFVAVNVMPVSKFIGYSLKEQFKDMIPAFVMAAIMAVIVWLLNFLQLSSFFVLVIQIITGIVLYCVMSYWNQNNEFKYLLSIVKGLL